MKNYTSDAPVWSDYILIVEENDLINDENDNARAIQLLQNDLVLRATKVDKEAGKSLVSDTERTEWNAMYQQATGYTDQKIADLIGGASSTLDTLGEIEKAMRDNGDVVEALDNAIGTKANQKEMESLLGTKLDRTGDVKDTTITYSSSDTLSPSSWAEVALFKTGEKFSAFANKVSTMAKNVRYFYKMLGTTDISKIGNGTVTGALSSLKTEVTQLNGNLAYEDITDKLPTIAAGIELFGYRAGSMVLLKITVRDSATEKTHVITLPEKYRAEGEQYFCTFESYNPSKSRALLVRTTLKITVPANHTDTWMSLLYPMVSLWGV